VKQSDLGEYDENVIEKQNIQVYKVKHKLPLKSRQNTSFPSNQGKPQTPPQIKPYGWQPSSSELKRVVTKTRDFSMQKTILLLNPRRNKLSIKFNQRRQLPLKWRTQDFIK
jgi:hypothetical protein